MKMPLFFHKILCLFLCMVLLAGCAAPAVNAPEQTVPGEPGEAENLLRFEIPGDSPVMTELTQKQRLTPVVDRAPEDGQQKEYTVLVYIVGSNLESQAGCASKDIREMLSSGLDTENCNLLIYTGGSKSWDMDIPSDCNTLWAMTAEGELEVAGATENTANMGSTATFLDFLCYSYNYFPARQYALICWDHGGGPLYGYGNDELYGYDCLTMEEMGAAMAQSPFAGEKLAFVGFDACLMASMEVADLFAPYARYLVASEETEPGSGWDYSFLQTLNTTQDPVAVSQAILETYEASMRSSRWRPEYTLSCLDLSRVAPLMGAMEDVYAALIESLVAGQYAAVAKHRNDTKRFALGSVSDLSDSYDLVDLGNLLENLSADYPNATAPAMEALSAMVLGHVSNLENTAGLSMYFPYDNKSQYQSGGDTLANTCMDYDNYEVFLRAFTDCWLYGETDVTWEPEQQIVAQEDYLELTLNREQLDNVAAVTYNVLEFEPETDTYRLVLADLQAGSDEAGTVRIPRDPRIYKMHTDMSDPVGEDGTTWPMKLAESGVGGNVFVSVDNLLLTSQDLVVGGTQRIRISLTDDPATGQVQIRNVIATSTDALLFGKQDVDISHYGCIAYDWEPRYITYDSSGAMLPWNRWETNGWQNFTYLDYVEGFWLEAVPLSSQEGIYYAQIIMTDLYGQVVGVRLELLQQNTPYRSAQIVMAEGTMTFRVYDDHAVVTGFTPIPRPTYEYLQLDVTVPSHVEGIPVTVVGDNSFKGCLDLHSVVIPDSVEQIWYSAFSSCYYLKSVELPENLRYIGNGAFSYTDLTALALPQGLESICASAFAGTDLTEVDLPDSVTYIGPGAFYGCEYLTRVNIRNDVYRSRDGVLYTADGKQLLLYPGGKWEASYTVPDGVEVIGPAAFRGNLALMEIHFPESLRIIDRLAFCNVTGLTDLEFPRGLEQIGSGAFAVTVAMAPSESVGTVRIGENVSWIGREAFAGYRVQRYSVDTANAWYASANGCLLNKSGTKLIQAPCGLSGKLVIPSGVSYIEWESLYDCAYVTELVIPDSVVSISHAAGVPMNLEKVTVGSGLSDWQNVHQFGDVPQITISRDNPYYSMVDGSVYSQGGTVLCCARPSGEDFVIPQGVTTIASNAFYCYGEQGVQVRTLTLPASLTRVTLGFSAVLTDLEEFRVHADNPVLASWDGLLYSRDGTVLYAAPLAKTGTVRIREGTVEIAYRAFYYGGNLKADAIIVPEGVTVIRSGNFSSCPYRFVQKLYLPASLTDIHPDMLSFVETDEMLIFAPAGSRAEEFAENWGFEVQNEYPET